jgi:tetratricopeptide (TPR) repeat protein
MTISFLLDPRRRFCAVSTGILLFSLFAFSTVQAKDAWISVRSNNFFLVGNAGEKDLRKVATRLEQFRDVFTRLLPGAKFETPVPTTVLVFKSMSSYKPFNSGNNAGYFQKGEDVNYITLTTELGAQNPYSVIYHEYVHLMVDNTIGNVPTWFNEGLAEYYSSFDIEDDRKAHLGELIGNHLLTLREEKLLPLRTLFAVDHYSPHYNENGKRGVFYAQSWALVHYLILGNNGRHLPGLGKFLRLIGDNVKIDEAFQQAFQMDVATMEKELKKYVEGSSFKMQVATFDHKLEFDSELKVAPLSEAEAQTYLGDLLLHLSNLDAAEARLQQALALDPKLTMAQASLGILRARQGQFAAAKKNLQAAVSNDSNNYLAHYYYAYALSREGMDASNMIRSYPPETASTMRAELKKAIQLSPTFPESYSLLAFVNMVTGDQLDDSVALLNRALALSPGRQGLNLMLAQIYMRQQKFDLARQALDPLANSKDRRLQSQSKTLLDSIRSYEEQTVRYDARAGLETKGQAGPPRLQREGQGSQSETKDAETKDDSKPESESDALRQTLRQPEAGEERIQGRFIKMECDNSKGISYFIVQAGDRVYKIRAVSLGQVQLTAYTPVAAQVTCGPRKTPENVVFTFRPSKDPKDLKGRVDGDAVALELVPGDFQLKK